MVLGVHLLAEHERGVLFRLGKFEAVIGPGLVIRAPLICRLKKYDLRTRSKNFKDIKFVLMDETKATLDLTYFYRIIDPKKTALFLSEDYEGELERFVMINVGAILSKLMPEDLPKKTDLSPEMRDLGRKISQDWGIKIEEVKIHSFRHSHNPRQKEVACK